MIRNKKIYIRISDKFREKIIKQREEQGQGVGAAKNKNPQHRKQILQISKPGICRSF